MKANITIYHTDQDWLVDLLVKHFEKICEAVEREVRKEKLGLPWRKEKNDDFTDGFTWELEDYIEISFSEERKEGGLAGASWMLPDFWMKHAPPKEEKNG
ncbi:MAG: hypothetical protein Q6361_01490 [Candidatus Hermodarchaeota archaeon]|nr:hypothetical protein [Candidatus Hermodarchaeota archaeon]